MPQTKPGRYATVSQHPLLGCQVVAHDPEGQTVAEGLAKAVQETIR